MSKLFYKHKATGIKMAISKTYPGPFAYIELRQLLPAEQISYRLIDIPYSDDWEIEDWDYSERFSFDELRIIQYALRTAVDTGMIALGDPLFDKCQHMRDIELKRIKQEPEYEAYVGGEHD